MNDKVSSRTLNPLTITYLLFKQTKVLMVSDMNSRSLCNVLLLTLLQSKFNN